MDLFILGVLLWLVGLLMRQDVEDFEIIASVSMISGVLILEDDDLVSLLLSALILVISSRLEVNWCTILVLVSMGVYLIIDSEDLLILYGGIELQSLGMYVLLMNGNMNRSEGYVTEGSIKYLLLSSLGSGLILLGGLLYYESGYMRIEEWMILDLGEGGILCILIGFLIKLGIFPVVDWMLSVVDGVEDISGMILSSISKIGYLCVLMEMKSMGSEEILEFVGLMSLLSSGLGCFYARRWKRFLVWSSLGHLGMLLLSLGNSWITYLLVYMLVSWCLWEMQLVMGWTYIEDIIDSRKETIKGLFMLLMMCILSGIPPFIGFIVKIEILLEMIDKMMLKELLVVIGYILLSSFNYMRIVRAMYFDSLKRNVVVNEMKEINGDSDSNDILGVVIVILLLI